ncbi:hypothetical protein HaLaN_15541 [Haematococcus lacustris]|uniref:Uncharacterized protein n=1 Tax=Haematococcus lacustris TaxID=44745 RepID=A0A699Z7U1_HAELA|nr:hypothetical protein HaLaN_15541 [Haematococcus lacustris]
MAGSQGLACSKGQQKQLSCLVRVQHLIPAYAQARVPTLKWFDIPGAPMDIVVLAASCKYGMAGVVDTKDAPPAWSSAHRKKLDPDELLRRSTIRWDVPRQQLVDLLASKDLTTKVYSEPVYLAGTGCRLYIKLSKKNSQDTAAGFTLLALVCELVSYAQCENHHIGEKMKATPLQLAVYRQVGKPEGIAWLSVTMVTNCGWSDWLQTALVSPEDLEPFLEGGCLQVTACFRVPHNGKKLP